MGEGEETGRRSHQLSFQQRRSVLGRSIALPEWLCQRQRSPPFISIDLDSLPWHGTCGLADLYVQAHGESCWPLSAPSRGCSQRCSFCSQQLVSAENWRGRSPENVRCGARTPVGTRTCKRSHVRRETPTLDRKRWERILDLLMERDLWGTKGSLWKPAVDDILRDEDIMGEI